MVTAEPNNDTPSGARRSRLAVLGSVKLTVSLMILIATVVLIGAWCPQESQGGIQKVIDQFGEEWALNFKNWGITDIFHSPFFLALIGMLTLNMIACSVQRVFPKVRLLRQPPVWLGNKEIGRLPFNLSAPLSSDRAAGLSRLVMSLKKLGYKVHVNDGKVVAEKGKWGRLAATITHIGLLSLLFGVTITSWTGFSGFKPVPLEGSLSFGDSEHSKLWVGKLPEWRVFVNSTRREDYPNGEAKQWYSDLSVIDSKGQVAKRQQIAVNEPLSYDGVDIYQSSWGLDQLQLSFNGHTRLLELRPMGKLYAAFLPLEEDIVLIFSVRDQTQPIRVFGKMPNWEAPRMLTEIPIGKTVKLGSVELKYEKVIPVTGLQYKCDPGLPITYVAFGFIMVGVMLAAVPYRQVWACVDDYEPPATIESQPALLQLVTAGVAINSTDSSAQTLLHAGQQLNGSVSLNEPQAKGCILYVGGRSLKGRTAFEKSMTKLVESLQQKPESTNV